MDQVDGTAAASIARPVRPPITTPPLNISISRELAIAGESEYDESDSVEHHPLAAANEDLAATTELVPAAALPHVSFSAGILARRNISLNEPSPLSPLPSTTTAGQSAAPLPLGGPAFLSRRPTPNFRGRSMKSSPSRTRRFFSAGPSPHASPDSKLSINPGAIDDSEEERRWSSEDDDDNERKGTSNSGSSFWRFFEEGGRWAWFPAIGDSNDRPSTGKGRFALEAFLPQIYHPRWTIPETNAILSTWCLLSSLLAGISASLLSFYNHIDRSVMENNAADPNTVASSGVPALVFHCNFAALTINIYSALLAAVSMVASVTLQTIQREEQKKLAKQKKRRRSSETSSSEGHKQQQHQDEQHTEEEQPRKRGLLLGNGHRLKALRSRASSRGNQEQVRKPNKQQQATGADQEPGIPLAIIGQLPFPSTSAETSSVTNSLPPLPPFERLGSSMTAAASSICSTVSKSTVASVVASAAAAVGSSRRASATPSSSSQNTSSTQSNASTTNPTPTTTDTTNGGGSSKPSSSSTTSSLPLAHLFLTSVLDELTLLCGFLIPFSAIIELFGLTFFAYTRHHAFEGMTFAIVLMSGCTGWSILRGCWRGREREREREEREERELKVEKEERKRGRDV